MEHVVQFGINIDDTAIAEAVKRDAYKEIIKKLTDEARKALPREYSYGSRGNYEVDDRYVKATSCMTMKDAAEALGVSIGRVSQLAKGGLLDAVHIDGKRMVTIASVNARIENPPSHHRPKRS